MFCNAIFPPDFVYRLACGAVSCTIFLTTTTSTTTTTTKTGTMAEEPDFFKPHPHPVKARVKNSMFDMVPDAFEEKTLTLTGDIRRVKHKPKVEEEPVPEAPAEKEADPEEEEEKTPVQESAEAETQQCAETQRWDGGDDVSTLSNVVLLSFPD